MKKNNKFDQLNEKLKEHISASGYTLVKDDRASSGEASAPRSESAKMTLAAQAGKPSSRKAFDQAHANTNTTTKPNPNSLLMPKPVKPLLKPLAVMKPKA